MWGGNFEGVGRGWVEFRSFVISGVGWNFVGEGRGDGNFAISKVLGVAGWNFEGAAKWEGEASRSQRRRRLTKTGNFVLSCVEHTACKCYKHLTRLWPRMYDDMDKW